VSCIIKLEDTEVGEWYYEILSGHTYYSLVLQKNEIGVDCVEFITTRVSCIGHQYFVRQSWDPFLPVYEKVTSTNLAKKMHPDAKEKNGVLYIIEKEKKDIIENILLTQQEKIDEIRKRVQNQGKGV